jgi:hypothetical protein
MAAQVAFEEGLTGRPISGETIRATLSRVLGVRWMRAKRWITSPDPLYERKKASFASDRLMNVAEADPDTWVVGFMDECWWSRLALPTLSSWSEQGKPLHLIQKSVAKDDPSEATKAISCYGLYVPEIDQPWIRFVDGRPVSSITPPSFSGGVARSSKRGARGLWCSSGTTPLGTSPKSSGAGSERITGKSSRAHKG